MRSLLVLEDDLPAGPRAGRLRVRRDRRRRRLGARDRGAAADAGLRARRPAPQQAGAAVAARRHPHRGQPRRRRRRPRGGGGRGRERRPAARPRSAREALLAPVLERRRGPGEADLPRSRAPDGTSVFFCGADAGWLDDFVALEPEPANGGVAGVRYPGSTTSRSRSRSTRSTRPASSTARCSTCAPRASAELAAPGGLVRSRALASADGRVRIVLNVPALAGTQRGQAELQHVAFACDDALAAARAMHERGAPILPDPRQLLRRPRRALRALVPRRAARARRPLRPQRGAASSCTSTARSRAACSSRCSSGGGRTTATAP